MLHVLVHVILTAALSSRSYILSLFMNRVLRHREFMGLNEHCSLDPEAALLTATLHCLLVQSRGLHAISWGICRGWRSCRVSSLLS